MTIYTTNISKNSAEVVRSAKAAFESGKTRDVGFREKQLKALMRMYKENGAAMMGALAHDLRKSKQESILLEIEYLINDLRYTLNQLREWVKPERPAKTFVNLLGKTCSSLVDFFKLFHDFAR